MSQQTVGIAIDRLLNDERLRLRFAFDRLDALAELYMQGIELTPEEIDAFSRIDVRLLFWSSEVVGGLLH